METIEASKYMYKYRKWVYGLTATQLLILIGVSSLWCIRSWQAVVSVWLGGAIWFIPNYLFVLLMLRISRRPVTQRLQGAIFLIMLLLKVLLSAVLIMVAVKLQVLDVWAFLSGVGAAIVVPVVLGQLVP